MNLIILHIVCKAREPYRRRGRRNAVKAVCLISCPEREEPGERISPGKDSPDSLLTPLFGRRNIVLQNRLQRSRRAASESLISEYRGRRPRRQVVIPAVNFDSLQAEILSAGQLFYQGYFSVNHCQIMIVDHLDEQRVRMGVSECAYRCCRYVVFSHIVLFHLYLLFNTAYPAMYPL